MQCPRCGWQNPDDVTACLRCGLAVPGATASGPPSARSSHYPPPGYGAPSQAMPGSGYGAPGSGYGQPGAGYGDRGPGFAAPGAGYGAPGAHSASYGQQPAQYSGYGQYPAGGQGPYGLAYGGAAASWYGEAPPAPGESPTPAHDGTLRLARVLLGLAAVASVVYAVWALTARRGIFQDFVDQRAVGLGRARTSDHVDTTLIATAGGLAILALALWLVRLAVGRARGNALTVVAMVLSALAGICIVVGLVLSGTIGSTGNRVTEAGSAVTATVVTGAGFAALAVGLILGLVVVNGRRTRPGKASVPDRPDDRTPAALPGG